MIPLKDDNPSSSAPVVTISLIVLNIMVFGYELLLEPTAERALIYQLGMVPRELTHPFESGFPLLPYFSIVTSMFVHGGFLHLGSNMLYLWIFGDNVEDIMGRGRFLLFYLITGTAAALSQTAFDYDSTIPMVGASGAVSGILGAYVLKFPRAKVLVLFPFIFFIRTIRVSAVFVLGLWFVMQLVDAFASLGLAQQGGVAFFAHVEGFVAGLALINLFARQTPALRTVDIQE